MLKKLQTAIVRLEKGTDMLTQLSAYIVKFGTRHTENQVLLVLLMLSGRNFVVAGDGIPTESYPSPNYLNIEIRMKEQPWRILSAVNPGERIKLFFDPLHDWNNMDIETAAGVLERTYPVKWADAGEKLTKFVVN